MRYIVATFLLAIALFLPTPTRSEELLVDEMKEAMAGIQAAPYFAIGGVGFVGSISQGEKNLQILLTKRARFALLKLTRDKSDIARLYGLTGLHYLNAAECKMASEPLLASKAEVQTCRGCLIGSEPVAEVAQRIVRGEYTVQIQHQLESK